MARTERTKATFDEEKGTVHLALLNSHRDDEGNVEWTQVGERVYSFNDLPKEIQMRCALFGFQQAIQQRASDENGEKKLEEFDAVVESLNQGNWTRRSSAGSGPVPLYVRAVAALYGVSESDAMRSIQNYSTEEREKIKENPKVKEKIEALRAESQEASPDLSDLMH